MNTIDRPLLSHLLIMGPQRPTAHAVVPLYNALVAANYATKAPLGDDRHEYKITQTGVDYLVATKGGSS